MTLTFNTLVIFQILPNFVTWNMIHIRSVLCGSMMNKLSGMKIDLHIFGEISGALLMIMDFMKK